MKYRSIDRHLTRRLSIHGGLWSNMNLPRIAVGVEQGCEYIDISYGSDGCDAVFGFTIDLAGTWVGWLICETYWRTYRWRHRQQVAS